MKDSKKDNIVDKVEAYWWLPFLLLTIGGMVYSIFTEEPLSDNFSYAMLACSILAFIGWLTRKKHEKRGRRFRPRHGK